MSQDKVRNFTFGFFAVLIFILNILTISFFFNKSRHLDFWMAHWFIGLFLWLCLFVVGAKLLTLTLSAQNKILIGILASGYIITSLYFYVIWGHDQILGTLAVRSYFGQATLVIISFLTGVAYVKKFYDKALLYLSGLYGIAGLAVMCFMIYKYVYAVNPQNDFDPDVFWRGISILFIGFFSPGI